MKARKITYWVSTIALALFILPGLFFMNSELAKEGMKHVGIDGIIWLQQIIGIASPLAIIAILIPQMRDRVKEWAYAAIGFIYMGAFWAHFTLGHPINEVVMPIVTFAILALSYYSWVKIKNQSS